MRILVLLGAVALALQAHGAQAQDIPVTPAAAPDSTAPRVVRDDTVYVAPKVHVTGRRITNDPATTTTSTRVERQELTRYIPSNVGDAIATVPGVDVVKTGPWDARVSMRGVSGDRVLVMVDGVRINEARGHGAEPSLVAVEDVEAIEVMPGAGSVRYGSNALGGVVNLVTKRSLMQPQRNAWLQLGTRLLEPGAGQAGNFRLQMRNPAWGVEVAAGLGRLDALTTPTGEVPNSSYGEENASIRFAARAGSVLFDAEHKHTMARDVGLPAFNSAGGSNGSYPERGREASRLEVRRLGSGYVREARVLADLQRFKTRFDEVTVDSVFVRQRYVGDRENDASDDIHTNGFGIAPSIRLGLPGQPRLQIEYRRDATDGPREVEAIVRDRTGTEVSRSSTMTQSVPTSWRDAWSAGLLLQQDVRTVRLETGVRWDQVHARAAASPDGRFTDQDVIDSDVSVEGGLSRAFGAFEPYLHAGTGFRAPNLDERYFNGFMHGAIHVFGNPDLESEHSVSGEAGLRLLRGWGPLQTARVSVYRSNVEDLITLRYVGQLYLVPRFEYVNLDNARLEGLESLLQFGFRRATLAIAGSVPRGTDLKTDERIADVGPSRVTFDIGFPLPRFVPGGSFSTRVRWSDAVQGLDTEVLARPSFWTTSAQFAATFHNVQAEFAVRNLFDAAYQEPLSFIPEAGRTFALALRMNFELMGNSSRATTTR